jgi:HAD superfamily hydrolase (TIGR01549 family)
MSDKRVKAILMDVGQPIVEDSDLCTYWNPWLADYLSDYLDRKIDLPEILGIQQEAIDCFAPSIFSYVIWHYVKPDRDHFAELRHCLDTLDYSEYLKVRPEAAEICRKLSEKYILATAANQPAVTSKILEDAGVLRYFRFKEMSGNMAFSKPDARFFEHILDSIGVVASDAVMVGDRQDNDIAPAKMIGMRAIRFRTGLFRDQIVRIPAETPDAEVSSLGELPELMIRLQSG